MKLQSQITVFLAASLLAILTIPTYGQDTIPPAIRCKTGVLIVLPVDEEITIDAKEFDDGSLDDFTSRNELKFYLNGDPMMTSYTVNCDSFKNRGVLEEFRQELYFNVEDNAGNVSTCQVELVIQDNKFLCGRPILNCSGCIRPWNRDMTLLPVRIDCSNDTSACYSIEVAQPRTLDLCRNWDNLNGVSTADIVMIQRHLLGLAPFEHPFQLYAADANNTETVSAADISTIRKIILGVIDDFSDYDLESWRFFHQIDSTNFEEGLTFTDTINCPEVTDVTAVKVGDVHPPSGGLNGSITRGEASIEAMIRIDQATGEAYFSLARDMTLSGLQMKLAINDVKPDFNVRPGRLEISEGHHYFDGYNLALSWNPSDGGVVSVNAGTPLFYFTSADFEDLSLVSGELYDEKVRTLPIRLGMDKKWPMEVYPNPCRAGDLITVNGVSEAQEVILSGLNGTIHHEAVTDGRGSVAMESSDLVPGVYFIILDYGDGFSAVRKIIIY